MKTREVKLLLFQDREGVPRVRFTFHDGSHRTVHRAQLYTLLGAAIGQDSPPQGDVK